MGAIIAEQVTKRYADAGGNPFLALNQVSLQWNKGENISIIGESGSGKSTLARLLAGLERPTGGHIWLDGEACEQWGFRRWMRHRADIQAVFQDTKGTLNPAFSVRRNVEEALYNLTSLTKTERAERVDQLMQLTGMDARLLTVPAGQLSGGEQRRMALIRALSVHPKYLILDEVTSGLDLLSSDAVLSLLETYHRTYGCSCLLITHDRQAAFRLSDRIYEMKAGVIVSEGRRKERKGNVYEKEQVNENTAGSYGSDGIYDLSVQQ